MTETPDHRDRSGDPPDDESYPFVDVRGTAVRKSRAKRTSPRASRRAPRRGRGRQGAEVAIGALVCMAAVGLAVRWLLGDVLGYPRDLCLVAAGLAAGLATWLGPALTAARLRLAAIIAPRGAR